MSDLNKYLDHVIDEDRFHLYDAKVDQLKNDLLDDEDTRKAICDDLFSSGELTDVVSEIVRAKRMGMTMTGEKAVDSLLSKFDSCAFFMAEEKLK